MHMQKDELDILLVEDSEVDVMLMQEMMESSRFPNKVIVCRDGVEAMEYLNAPDKRLPHLILLDINMPKMNGKEVLKEIKTHPQFRSLPVIILTSSRSPRDVEECYNLYTNSYIPKPDKADEYDKLLNAIEDFWMDTALIPGRSPLL